MTTTSTVVLYQSSLNPDCLQARFLLSALDVDYETVPIDDVSGQDEASLLFLRHNGALPVLRIADETSRGAPAVLRHIVEKLDGHGRFADDSSGWLEFAASELTAVTDARSAALFGPGASAAQLDKARAALLMLEDELCLRTLAGQFWFSENAAAVADIALYPAVALMRDIGLEFEEFPTLRSWLDRMRALAPSVSMPGISDIR